MAKKLNCRSIRAYANTERGFVLATSLIMLMLLTMLSIGVMYSGIVSQRTSAIARDTTEAFYFAETGINYMAWALNNDAEFDSYAPIVKRASGVFAEPALPTTPAAATVGDRFELYTNLLTPGPTTISDTGSGTTGQIMYFDNSAVAGRTVRWPLLTAGGNKILPVFSNISTSLPRYIKLEIDLNGTITPVIPALPHADPPVAGTDVPNNGVIVWITAGDTNEDAEIQPIANCPGAVAGQSCYKGATAANPTAVNIYSIVAYAIGYVDGRPMRMLRAVIM